VMEARADLLASSGVNEESFAAFSVHVCGL
jgi:hypothetical protein